MDKRFLSVLFSLSLIIIGAIVAISYARGYRLDVVKNSVVATGILVATSDPDGAEVIIDGKLVTATNNTLNLKPGKYQVKFHREGFSAWEKQIEIKKEEVIKTNAFLFPLLPDLRPLTFSGALNPAVSPDGTHLAFGVASASAQKTDGNGLWVLDMGRNLPVAPFLSPGEFRQITVNSLSNAKLTWSLDNKQLMASASGKTYILQTDRLNQDLLPSNPTDFIKAKDTNLIYSPDETKYLYTATVSAYLPPKLTNYLPGKNPTPEARNLIAGKTYVYDIKEDKNYLVPNNVSWFPSSRHLLSISENEIAIMEFDGTNKSVVYSGQFNPKYVFVWPNWSKVVILTTLGNPNGVENLYTINLR